MDRWNPNLFLKEGQSLGYDDKYLKALVDQAYKIDAEGVPVVFSLAHLARLSRTLYADLHAVAARKTQNNPNFPYKNFPIRKRSGGTRWISVPVPALMAVQQWIAQNILNSVRPHRCARGYVHGLKNPLLVNARGHCGARWVLKMDIENFFSNISERQVYDVFKSLNYTDLLSFEMARLCTRVTPKRRGHRWNKIPISYRDSDYACSHIGSLPQGAPSSPALSNLVCISLDNELERLARNAGATYSRYADDLCFSFLNSSRDEILKLKREVNAVLWKSGFCENKKKTRIIPPSSRQLITGLAINSGKPTIPREMRDKVRMHLHFCKKFGIPKHCEEKGFRSVIGFRNHLHGLIMYVFSVNPEQGKRFLKDFNELPWVDFAL